MRAVSAVLVGAGSRGRHTYGAWALDHPDRLRFVAVVEPDPDRRRIFGDLHGIPSGRRFPSLPDARLAADAWVVAGPDRTHAAASDAAIREGTALLLEKPMGATAEECVGIVRAAEDAGILLQVSLVLRHTPFFSVVRDIVASGRLGDVVDVAHRENVVAWHMAHSFVRGNWSKAGTSTPMVVQKTCHDFDLVSWITGRRYETVASFGSLTHFRPSEAPAGAADRCTDPCPVDGCPFDARRLYLDERRTGWPVDVITDDLSRAGRLRALAEGPYGRCVYQAGSDVVDHQVVAVELEGGATATVTLHGHAPREERTMRYEGTRATLRGLFGVRQEIEILDHVDGSVERVPLRAVHGGHGGGDDSLIDRFVTSVASGAGPEASTGRDVLEGHLASFAAERSRVEGRLVSLADVRRTAGLPQ